MEVNVRKACEEDIEQLFVLVRDFAASFTAEEELFQSSFKTLISEDATFLYVAEHGGDLIGYCLGFDHYTFYANGRVAWVEEIMVNESYRRSGVGGKLMDAFEEWAKARGAKLIGLATRRAESFYNALGYEESAVFFRKLL